MRTTLARRALATTAALLTVVLSACSAETEPATATGGAEPATTQVSADAEQLLAQYGLDGMETVEIIDHLDRLGGPERPAEIFASVKPDQLVVSTEQDEVSLAIPEDRFYLSVAPYVDQTHDCFHHSLTTCVGELASTDVQVQIVDATNDEVLVDETRTTFANGFIGFWLPRDIEGTLRVTLDGRTAETGFATNQDAPTCLTTLQLT